MSTTKAPQHNASVTASKQNAPKKQGQAPAVPVQQSQQQQQQVRDIEQENRNMQIYHDIVEEEKKVFGKKYPLREKEPSMFDMLKWEAPLQQKCDFKSNHLPDAQIDQYKSLINKSADPFQTEQRDNYRQFYADKANHVLIPEVEPEVIGQLKSHHIATQARPGTATTPAQESLPNEASQVRGVKSSYQREFGRANIHNAGELAEIVKHNHANRQTSSQALLEQAQKKKRISTEPNKLYDEEEVVPVNPDTEEEEEEHNGSEDGNKENGGKNSKGKQQQQRGDPKIKSFKGVETKNVKSKLIKYKPQAVKLDPAYQQERILRRKERIGQMEETTRWLPNSAFTTYFGKPAFENYGRGNVNPSIGGCVYGQYLLSHNVNPHRGIHQPQFIQSYNNALNFGERLPESEPQPPRNVKEDFRLSQNQVEELKGRIPLTATRNKRDNLVIKKPDLINSLRFASNENSPVNAAKSEEEKRKRIQNSLKELKEGTKAHTAQRTNQSFTQFADPQQQQQQAQSTDPQRPQSAAPAKKSVKITENAPVELTQEQIQANQEWAADLPRNKFIDEMNRKKAKKNRITLKVTEVIPVLPASSNQSNKGVIAGISSQKKNSLSPSRISLNTPQYQVPQIPTDQLGAEAQLNLADKLHNPKLYKNAPSVFTKYIPFAGKESHVHDDIKSVFHYENIEDSDDEEF